MDEQYAAVRVMADASGTAVSVTVLSDPGLGFGPAARRCAMREQYVAARDRRGRAVKAMSAPIRVRFTR